MTSEEIQQAVLLLGPWHHNHIFPGNISTGDSDVEATHPKLVELLNAGAFPRNVYQRVLDLGANSGLISMWFVDNRQSHVTAVEGNPRYYQQLELAIKLKGYEDQILPIQDNLHLYEFKEFTYDLVLFLGTLHHLRPETHMQILRSCYKALVPAGEIVVQTDSSLAVETMLQDAGFLAVRKYDNTSWHDRAAWFGLKDPMKLW